MFFDSFTEGANGDGMAIVSSLRSFDREQQKEYEVPIVIKDSGNPSMSGTSTLTIIIGDSNDNKMQPGSKEILVYNYMVSFCLLFALTLFKTIISCREHDHVDFVVVAIVLLHSVFSYEQHQVWIFQISTASHFFINYHLN